MHMRDLIAEYEYVIPCLELASGDGGNGGDCFQWCRRRWARRQDQ